MKYGNDWRNRPVPRTFYVIAMLAGIVFGVVVALAIYRLSVKPG
jgi:high-affinity Fe2+/Pb2+ permease